jgi:hypothetical protein
MTYRWIDDQGLLKKVLGERRIDPWTAAIIDEALRDANAANAARTMAWRRVNFDVALRVLSKPAKRRRVDGPPPTR